MEIAVIGIGCRFPGEANTPDAYWKLMMDGVDAIQDVPEERWRHQRFYHPEKGREHRTPQRQGGFIRLELFDGGFFGISPREAAAMDPQQRLMLEVAWEALEDAGLPLESVAGTPMGVYTGCAQPDYSEIQAIDSVTTHSISGWSHAMVANRVSYAFDLRGPSLNIDTACSSALVAVHHACQSLARGECTTALAGGVNAIINPLQTLAFSALSMLSPTSRCHAFDVSADGFVRSEGAGVVVLKPLERAVADGDRIYAVILSTAVNSDGRNEGLTVPSVDGQTRLLKEAYRNLPIERVAFVEAHGTGTQVGDPVEIQALGSVLGRPDRPLTIGSVKTNIGHLEAAAGAAGLIKACLVAWHGLIPRNLHFNTPNPGIPFDKYHVEIPTEPKPLPADALLGVNSFGFGGTNGHVVLRVAPRFEALVDRQAPHLICLSARSEASLKRLQERVSELDAPVHEVAAASVIGRTHHAYRMAVVAESLEDVRSAVPVSVVRQRPRIGFVYSGQGSQWVGMGRSLMGDPGFAGFVEECEPWFVRSAGWSLREALQKDDTEMDRTAIAQPLIFALQAGLTRMLRAWGVEPEVVVGHSVGEVAAAWASGSVSLKDAVHLVVNRGRVMERKSSRGRMLAVMASPEAVQPYLQEGVCVGAVNAPGSVTLSGASDAVAAVTQRLRQAGFDCTEVRVEYAFHSAQLDVVQPELLAALSDLSPGPCTTNMISTATGETNPRLDAAYWWQNVRAPVRFADAIKQALASGVTVFVEVGGHPVLGTALMGCAARSVPTLRRHQPERKTFLEGLAELYRLGQPLRAAGRSAHRLPRYPWQHERMWQQGRPSRMLNFASAPYAMLGTPTETGVWSMLVSPQDPPWMRDHLFQQQILLSASTLMEMGFEAAHARRGELPLVLEEVRIESACFIGGNTELVSVLGEDGVFSVFVQDGLTRTRLAGARLAADPGGALPEGTSVQPWEGSLTEQWATRGLQFGPSFDRIVGPGRVEGPARLPDEDGISFTHPGTIDSCFQMLRAAVDETLMGEGTSWVPVGARRVRLLRPLEEKLQVAVRTLKQTPRELEVDIVVRNLAGDVLMDVAAYRLVPASQADALDNLSYRMVWEPLALTPGDPRIGHWLVFSDDSALAKDLIRRLEEQGNTTHVVLPGARFDMRDVGEAIGCLHLHALSATLQDPAAPLLSLIEMMQQADAHDVKVPRLFVVTRQNLEAAPVWGLVRVLATEEPWLQPACIEVEGDGDAAAVMAELAAPEAEEVSIRQGVRYVRRGERFPLSQATPQPAAVLPETFALVSDRPGTLEALRWRVPAESSGEVRVEVAAAGLNFSDVMRAVGLYPTEGLLGIEMAGRVVGTGERVMGIAPGAFASHVSVPKALVVPTPERWTDVQAAGMPLVFVTACYALLEMGKLKPGERVLIHTGTGGLGQAAIQVARTVGAEILATAGSPDKRDMLRRQGIAHVYDSRTTAFADEIGQTVDMVLNTLDGERLTRSFDVLRRFGRFLDVTKRDIYGGTRIPLTAFSRALSYHAIDLEQIITFDPNTVQRWLQWLVQADVTPLPVETFRFGEAVEAFRMMSQARHVGKLVLTRETPREVIPGWQPCAAGTYLVTGGQGGFGGEVVKWLLQQGAGRVVIATRTPAAASDPRIEAVAVDVGDPAAVQALCDRLPGLRGIVHAAMLLDDTPTLKLNRERLEVVFRAKIHGAWNLHQATLHRPLDFFVMFSSNATLLGAAGQGNYSASNAFLDALAHYRRSRGLTALSVNWGPIGDVGYLARNPQVKAWLEQGGSRCITSRQALTGLARALSLNLTQVAVMEAEWPLILRTRRGQAVARFAALMQAGGAAETEGDLQGRVAILAALREQVARVLGSTSARIDVACPLSEMGLDSLMSLQLRNWVKATLNVTLSASALLAGPTLEQLADMLGTPAPAAAPPPPPEEPASIEKLDDDQIDALLGALLTDE
ncbi:MAG: type I polyketide synthase [Candidatus Xenobia bacterium]